MAYARWIRRAIVAALLTFPPGGSSAEPPRPTFPVPAGFRVEAFAHEPMFVNPVALSVDVDGAVYVTETRRRKANALDIRQNPDWLNNDLSFTNVAMKEAFYRSQLTPENSAKNRKRVPDLNRDGSHDWRDLTELSDVVHRLRDTDGDGRADEATVFAEGFNTIVSDVAAGVMARGRDVYVTVAPDLWRLRDTDGDGRADERVSLATGFAVHIAYAGHNMHGVTMGPDGRLYWSIADIGSNYLPHEGAVFRCEPDGSQFEVFARGLRNPHEFVFNELGDMFTADNDSDNGDRERWLHIVEGADYGWRNAWQFQIGSMWGASEDTYPLWNSEGLWHLPFPGQAAWMIPPAAHVGPGPCGMKFYPGGALDEVFGGRILLAEFTGSAGSSAVHRFTLKPNGATYDVASDEPFLTGIVATGLDFAPDGGVLFVADWAGGWDLKDKGRVWSLSTAQATHDDRTVSTRTLLRDGFGHRPAPELAKLLGHANLNVRREAQFALASKGPANAPTLLAIATNDGPRLARIHALWGLEQVNRQSPGALDGIAELLNDMDPEIRNQSARMLGEGHVAATFHSLVAALDDPEPRVRFSAAMALAKLRDPRATEPIQRLLVSNAGKDKHLRYAGIRALESIHDGKALLGARSNASTEVRLASTIALRRLERPEIAAYLDDPDPLVIVEAARAINDVPIPAALPALAALIDRPWTNEWIARRVLNACFRLGTTEHADQLARFAANPSQTMAMRREALRLLGDWPQPSLRDHVVGAWRPLTPATRNKATVRIALSKHLPGILAGGDTLRAPATRLASRLELHLDDDMLLSWVKDGRQPTDARIGALEMLASARSTQMDQALVSVRTVATTPPELYATGLKLTALKQPETAAIELQPLLLRGPVRHFQESLRALASITSTNLDSLLTRALTELQAGSLPPELRLDVVLAARDRDNERLRSALRAVLDPLEKAPLGLRGLTAAGGDPSRGRRVFFEKAETECVRCHKVTVNGTVTGGDAAPNLSGIGKRATRDYLVTSIVKPNENFAPGYDQLVLRLDDQSTIAGRVLSETTAMLELEMPVASEEDLLEARSAGAVVERKSVLKSRIRSRERGLSGMPEGLAEALTPFELRDLVEFLATQ